MPNRLAVAAVAMMALAGGVDAQEAVTSWRATGGPVELRLSTIGTGGELHEVDASGRSIRVLVAAPYTFEAVLLGTYAPGALIRFGSYLDGVRELQGAPIGTVPGGYLIDYWMELGTPGAATIFGTATIFSLTGVDAYFDPATGDDAGPNALAFVPEPSTWATVGTGLLAVGGLAYRRRRRAPGEAVHLR